MNTFFRLLLAGFALAMLPACVSVTPNFAAKPEFWNEKNKIIGVAMEQLPKPTTFKAGNQGLLDVAINNAVASQLETHLNGLDISKISELNNQIAAYLREKGFTVKQIKEPIQVTALPELDKTKEGDQSKYVMADRDFTSLKQKYGVDKMVLISVVRVGTIRSYYGFIPISAPSGLCHLSGKVIDLSNNHLEWNQVVTETVANGDGSWDVPPNYPSLTKAVYNALDESRNMLYNNFTQ